MWNGNRRGNGHIEGRALLTDRERELIEGGDTVDENLRYQTISRVWRKIEDELTTDVAVLRENYPGLYAGLCEVVCESEGTSTSSRGEGIDDPMQ
ncbi:hypothetical protein [Natrinema sp. JCM 9743]